MKLSLRSTTIGAIALLTSIGTIVFLTNRPTVFGAGVQDNAQAQTNIHEYQSIPGPPCKEDSFAYMRKLGIPAGNATIFYEFAGLKFTPQQQKTFDEAAKNIAAAWIKAPMTKLPFNPDGLITVSTEGRSEISEAKLREKYDAASAVNLDQISNAKQIGELNEKYGKNAEFVYEEMFVVGPREIPVRRAAVRAYEEAMLSVFDPAQKKVFLRNLKIKRDFESCAPDDGGGFPMQFNGLIGPN